MARVLIVVPPLAGHVYPTVTLGAELARRGHHVAWAGPAAGVAPRLAPGQALYDTNPEIDRNSLDAGLRRGAGQRGVVALKSLWEDVLLPLARAMLPGVTRAIEGHDPDVVIADQQALAGALGALRAGLPWVTSATTSAEMADPFASVPLVGRWIADELTALQVGAGVAADVAADTDLRRSPLLTVAYTTPELVGPRFTWPAPVCFAGPVIEDRVETDEFPWDWLDPARRRVLLTLGTLNAAAGGRFFQAAADALDRPDVQVVCAAPPELVPAAPSNWLVRSPVPQLDLLRRGVDAVVCHAGHNTVCETLARGVPLVLAPIRDDQPIVADQVVRAGAGVRVRFGRVRADGLAAAVRAVLDEPSYRRSARALASSFAAAGGAREAAVRVEAIVPARSGR
ncbi:glycosyltransferase [Acidiferrimicrobium sp. IK]|uniref:glycosyltransferase n=1 Tax=Acidiferrimicrobium sp. IK TaxID=2871700 RepID=UPI0021CB6576|nr:glycosyltransferase [Acidiferrimicrobium sp. IK]MCU4187009.1 glycosyltransferase [Acidiferrimicrobium sp. IK]